MGLGFAVAFLAPASVGVIVSVAVAVAAASDDAKPPSPQEVLKSKGLTREKGAYILLDEESAFFHRREESSEIFERFGQAFDAVADSAGNDQQMAAVDQQRKLLRSQITALEVEQARMFRRVRRNQMAGSPRDMELRLRDELNQATVRFNELRGRQLKPKEKVDLLADYNQRRTTCLERLDELQASAGAITKKYNELAKDASVRDALGALSRADKATYRVRPSDRFSKAVKELNTYRRNAGATPGSSATAKKAAAKPKATADAKTAKKAAK